MKVLIYADDVLGVHYSTNLELAAKHLHRGDEVHLLVCHGALRSCPSNNGHDRKVCVLCKSKLSAGLANGLMSRTVKHVLDLGPLDSIDLPEFQSMNDLKSFSIDGINHGMEAASSVISALRDPSPDMKLRREMVRGSLFTSVALYRAASKLLAELKPDLCYVLNGRRTSQMPLVRALREQRIKFSSFEIGHNWKKYILIEGTFFHDLEKKKREVEEYWNDATPEAEKIRIAHQFYHDRRFGSGDDYPEAIFKRNQHRGVLPPGFDGSRRNIAIFNSSEDEFAAIEGYENPVYRDQIDGLSQILHSPDIDPSIRFYLRVHPNLGQIRNYQTESIEQLKSDNLVMIAANQNVDSYALMENCEKVLTFGSAMNVESAYAGRTSILIGREPYEDLGSCYKPKSHQEAVAMLNDPALPALPNLGALKYGYYMVARDIPYEYFDPSSNTFEGNKLEPGPLASAAVKAFQVGPLASVNHWRRTVLHQISERRSG